jgi:Glycosyl hydrolase 36 superfamily, catalytic domain/Glycosyltransferase family 36
VAPAIRRLLAAALLLASIRNALGGTGVPAASSAAGAVVASTYGSGHFGAWFTDAFGLPAFRYDVDEDADPRARQPELAGATEAQHQVGNDNIVAAAFNHGYTQLWSQAREAQWANRYQPATRHYAGGYGYLYAGGSVLSTLYADRSAGSDVERDFGVGYARKRVSADGLTVEQVVYAPFGDDPLLLDDVTITNTGGTARQVSWFEYWDVNPFDQANATVRGLDVPVWSPETATLSVRQRGRAADTAPLSIFAAVLDGSVDGFETSLDVFFGAGSRAAPAAVAADALHGTLAPASAPGTVSPTLFAFRTALALAPGQAVTLRYAYGMAHEEDVPALVAKYRVQAAPLDASEAAWRDWLPRADFGRSRAWVARELVWDAYLLRSASVYEELCGEHTITQGGYYQYLTGLNLGFRSWPHYALPMVYADPELARQILRYSIAWQPEHGGQLPYGSGPLCTPVQLGTSGDLDVWLLLAAAEYGLGSRDTAFFRQQIPFFDTRRPVSVWDHVKRSFEHQESLRGPHGGYLAGTNGDWSDFSTQFLGMTESMLVTAQLAYVYPYLGELASRLGDRPFAAELRRRGAELRRVLHAEWTGRGWYSRGYGGDRQIGSGAIFGEPQPWAILSRAPSRHRAIRLVANIRRFLDGIGAPPEVHGPSRIGSSLSPARNDPDVTERSSPPGGVGDNNANYVGGVWFDVNGWVTWALGELDGVVQGARRYAWSEYTRNTLATHATAFPDHWAGTISVDDTCYAYYASRPAQCGNDLYRQYDGQITEQPTWMVMDAIRLAGITPTRRGYRIAPHLPFSRFSLRLPRISVAARSTQLRGYVRPVESGPIELRVKVPPGAATGSLAVRAGGRAVGFRLAAGSVVFRLRGRADAAADWAVTWRRRS